MDIRDRLCIALDTEDSDQAIEWTKRLSPYAGSFKIGQSLHVLSGLERRDIVREIGQVGGSSFLDLKVWDTPDQVERVARAVT
ncbi:MAG: orotidine 5'-phosphate decarboxylase / HUMPS family protein, partial [Nanobdellota archaeon]